MMQTDRAGRTLRESPTVVGSLVSYLCGDHSKSVIRRVSGHSSVLASPIRAQFVRRLVGAQRSPLFRPFQPFADPFERFVDAHTRRGQHIIKIPLQFFPDCPISTTNPVGDCSFYLAHAAVWEWALVVKFETNDRGFLETSWETIDSGVSHIVRPIDYADIQWTDIE